MTKKGLAQPDNVGWFQPELSKFGILSGFVGFTEFNLPKPGVSASGYSPKSARKRKILHVKENQDRKLETTFECPTSPSMSSTDDHDKALD